MSLRHFVRFNVASLLGLLVQVVTLWLLVHVGSVHYLLAATLAVAAAVVHNFIWHWRWTWADRRLARGMAMCAFGRFVVANGAVSLTSNVLMMSLLVGGLGVDPIPASLVAVAVSGLINFWLADQVVFRAPA